MSVEISPTIFAIVPIRHESYRLPGKNFLDLNGKPLYWYILDTLLQTPEITKILIDTNSPIIEEGCQKYFGQHFNKDSSKSKLLIIDRPKSLSGPKVSTNDLIAHLLDNSELPNADVYLQTHVTNPFLTKETIQDALKKFTQNGLTQTDLKSKRKHDSMFSVNKWQTRLYNKTGTPINHNPNELIQTQELPPIYEDNSCFYIFTRKSFYKRHNRIGGKPYMYPIESKEESLDIDWEDDFILAELYLERRKLKKNREKIALITGVSGGIGWATAKRFKKEGWTVIGTDLYERDISDKSGDESYPYESYPYDRFIQADLSESSGPETIISNIIYREAKLDALINIAAMQKCQYVMQTRSRDWDQVMNCNLKSPFFLAQRAQPYLLSGKNERPGSIVNVSSIHAFQTSDQIAAYAASKAGLTGLTRNLAIEFGKCGIRVNAVCPGAVDTPMLKAGLSRGQFQKKGNEDELVEDLGKKHIMGKVGTPEEIASVIYFLANSEESSFIVGSNLIVDGGATIQLSSE